MDIFLNKTEIRKKQEAKFSKINIKDYVEKTITANDIRARIVSIPTSIINKIDIDFKKINVLINEEKKYNFSVIRGRNYFGGVTQFLKDYKFISDEGVITPKQSKWFYDKENNVVKIHIDL